MSNEEKTGQKIATNPFLIRGNVNEVQNEDHDDDEIEEKLENFNSLTASYTEISLNNQPPIDILTVTTNDEGELVVTNAEAKESCDYSFATYVDNNTDETNSLMKNVRERPNTLLTCDDNKRKVTFPFNLEGEGTVSVDNNNMTHFVAENLEYKIKIASPVTQYLRPGSSSTCDNTNIPSCSGSLPRQLNMRSNLTQIDSNILNDIEVEAQYLSSSVDNLTENLCNLLHSISSITADNVDTYKNAVIKLTDSMDSNIKSMYTIMAKTEEISKAMQPAEQMAVRIRDIKRLVDMFESNL